MPRTAQERRTRWVVLGDASQVARGAASSMWLGDREYAVWRDTAGELRAADAACPHRGASLACGAVVDGALICPLHGWRFDGRGRNVYRPHAEPSALRLTCHRVIERDGAVWLALEEGPGWESN